MPPAVVPVQTSRAGLISALIASIIIAVAMTVVAVYYAQEFSKSETARAEQGERYKPLLAEASASDPRVQRLVSEAQSTQGYSGMTAMDIALTESENLAKLVGGSTSPDKAADAAKQALKNTATQINQLNQAKLVTFTFSPQMSLTQALQTLASQYAQLATERQGVQTQLASAEQKNQQTIQAQKDLMDQKDKQIQEANAKADAAEAQSKQFEDQAKQAQAALQLSATDQMKRLQDVNANLTRQMQASTKRVSDLTTLVDKYKNRIRRNRVNAAEAMIQQPDGAIQRLAEDGKTVFINIGQRQGVTKGLTFEIYDKEKGIPPLGDGMSDTDLPVGKGAIEVFDVGPDTSSARVTKREPGQQISVGDPIVNLVFDPNTKYNFVVYGNFDLSHSGAPTPTDTEIVKQKIAQWGGHVENRLDVDTDFLVMGQEPSIPQLTDPNDPIQVKRIDDAKKAYDNYESMIARAQQLGVTVLNQNRFLYLIGYYDLAMR